MSRRNELYGDQRRLKPEHRALARNVEAGERDADRVAAGLAVAVADHVRALGQGHQLVESDLPGIMAAVDRELDLVYGPDLTHATTGRLGRTILRRVASAGADVGTAKLSGRLARVIASDPELCSAMGIPPDEAKEVARRGRTT